MKIEPATILLIELGSITFFLLLLPLLVVLSRLGSVWRVDRGMGLILTGVVALTAVFFALFFVGLVAVTFSGRLWR